MKNQFVTLLAVSALVGLLLAGCSKNDPVSAVDPGDQLYGSAQTDLEFFQMYVQHGEFFRADELAMNDGENMFSFDDDELGKTMTPIKPLRWGRSIRNVSREVVVDSVTTDSLVYVTLTKSWSGVLRIAAAYSDTATVPDTLIVKPFQSEAKKRFIFKRIGRDRVVWRNWRPIGTSLMAGGTTSSDDITLTQLKLYYQNNGQPDSTTITDPLNTFFRLRGVTEIPRREVPDLVAARPVKIQATLTSADSHADHVVLRYGFTPDGMHHRRIRLQMVSETFDGANYIRVYERTFPMHFRRGVFTAAVDVMTHGTLFDDAADVASSFWGVPYVVRQ